MPRRGTCPPGQVKKCSEAALPDSPAARRRSQQRDIQVVSATPAAATTAANLRFAAAIEPDNADVQARAADLPICTTPTTVALELTTNPFVRAASAEVLAERRLAKDEFRG